VRAVGAGGAGGRQRERDQCVLERTAEGAPAQQAKKAGGEGGER
jgi:hypothetical protein